MQQIVIFSQIWVPTDLFGPKGPLQPKKVENNPLKCSVLFEWLQSECVGEFVRMCICVSEREIEGVRAC